MINDYTCPRCGNVFPSSNKMLHEIKCTEENPVPLNASRMVIPKETEIKQEEQNNNQVNNENGNNQENKDVIPQIPKFEQNLNHLNNLNFNEMNEIYNFEETPKQYLCEICNKMIDEKDKVDHILCHNLEKEQENEINNNGNNNNDINNIYGFSEKDIEEQRKIERQLERNKNKRINQQNRNIRENNHNNNASNILRNALNNINNNRIDRNNNYNYLSSNIANNRRPNTSNNNNNNNNYRHYQNNRNNQVNNGPVITIRQTGQNGNRIITRVYPNNNGLLDIQQQQNLNFISRLNRRHNNNLNNAFMDFGGRRHGNNVFNRFDNLIQEMMNSEQNRERPTDKQLFNEFPETKIEDINKLDPEKRNCVICLEDFKSGEKATLLPCVHLFHKNCIKSWLKSKNNCPICKFELTRANIDKQNNKFK